MRVGALMRSTLPYLLIAVIGFTLACGIVFFFVLPPTGGHRAHDALAQDSSFVAPEIPDTPQVSADLAPRDTETVPATQLRVDTPVVVPNVSGMSLTDARTALAPLGLGVVLQRDTSSFQPENSVLRQLPPAGTLVGPGDTVMLVISHFPPLIDTVGRSVPPARVHGSPTTP